MRAYIIRRLLLIPLTLAGITFIVFSITRFLPGGPLEEAIQQATMAEHGRGARGATGALSKEQLEQMRMSFGMNEAVVPGYLMWVGLIKREYNPRFVTLEEEGGDAMVLLNALDASGRAYSLKAFVKGREGKPLSLVLEGGGTPEGWEVRYGRNVPSGPKDNTPDFKKDDFSRVVVFQKKFAGLVQGDLQESLMYGDPVGEVIRDRIPVSLFFGLLTAILTYAISIPLGILKAIKHRTWVDNWSSVLLFVGYSIPGFALGSVMLLWFAFQRDWFPISGFVSTNFDELDTFGKVKDILHHTVLPLICYTVSGFALSTMMMKNTIMDVLASDFIRTAVAKGASFRQAIVGHALRNSLIPIAATFGQLLGTLVSGSFLIESVFDINGAGQLGFVAATHSDYNVMMGVLFLSSTVLMIGNILSDILIALINPRIRFE